MKTKHFFLFSLLMLLFSQLAVYGGTYHGKGQNRGYQGQINNDHIRALDANGNGVFDEGEVDPNREYSAGPCECYCPVTTFKPEYYCTTRCVEEPYCVQKKCTRYVPKYYTKQFCRYVPQYYTKQYCKQVPECYYVTETKTRQKQIKEQHCRYVPCTTVKRTCLDVCPLPEAPACPPVCEPVRAPVGCSTCR